MKASIRYTTAVVSNQLGVGGIEHYGTIRRLRSTRRQFRFGTWLVSR